MITKAVDRGLFQGFVIGKSENSVRLSHLQFADDLIIFCQASLSQIKNVKRVLRIFSIMTGLHLNLAKSKLLGINVEEEVLTEWALAVGCSVGSFPTDYLGLPLGAKKNSEALWDPVFKNFSSKLAGWKASCLSLAGRTILLKSISMGGNEEKRRIHWVNWKSVCKPLNSGVLGVFDVNLSNQALLGKWVWKFANEKNTLWKSVLCCRHKVSCNSMSISKVFSPKSSWIVRGIANNFLKNDSEGECIRSHSKLKVGNGKSISFWTDTWADEGLSPPRVEAFLWQLAHQKVAVREELVKRGMQLGDEILCPFCKEQVESMQHLFISCVVVWELWYKIVSFWDIALVLPKDPPSLISSWGELRGKSLIWKFIPGVVFWSI
ncbi:uncharacterized protein LOC120199656 [Hibiscus syriacus]|uniref:uncharacterized protein LOC120199656 n=1 Tax=Hibiscus syriacus TaxID=106335 RepID=UPI001924E976|nr:uncharacterized protein LOC120199656 [Hibiscus syriacus]